MANQTPMSATASHLVEFYGYFTVKQNMFETMTIQLSGPDRIPVLYDSNLKNPFDNTLFLGHESENTFIITSIIL
jgi:hypothetical protein